MGQGGPVALGLRALKGGAAMVGVAMDEPRVVLSKILATAGAGDRLAHDPYRVSMPEWRARRDSNVRPPDS